MRSFWKQDEGSAMVEFALALPIFLFFVAAIADYSYFMHQEMEITEAAAAGAAYGAIPGQQKNTAGMKQIALQAAPDVPNLSVTATYYYSCPSVGNACSSGIDSNPAMYVQVKTSATIPQIAQWPGMPANLALSGQATYRVPWTQ